MYESSDGLELKVSLETSSGMIRSWVSVANLTLFFAGLLIGFIDDLTGCTVLGLLNSSGDGCGLAFVGAFFPTLLGSLCLPFNARRKLLSLFGDETIKFPPLISILHSRMDRREAKPSLPTDEIEECEDEEEELEFDNDKDEDDGPSGSLEIASPIAFSFSTDKCRLPCRAGDFSIAKLASLFILVVSLAASHSTALLYGVGQP